MAPDERGTQCAHADCAARKICQSAKTHVFALFYRVLAALIRSRLECPFGVDWHGLAWIGDKIAPKLPQGESADILWHIPMWPSTRRRPPGNICAGANCSSLMVRSGHLFRLRSCGFLRTALSVPFVIDVGDARTTLWSRWTSFRQMCWRPRPEVLGNPAEDRATFSCVRLCAGIGFVCNEVVVPHAPVVLVEHNDAKHFLSVVQGIHMIA